jgi:signal transduction histidine kinase
MEPPASLASIATAAERTVETSSSWLGSVIAAEIASVEAELDQLNGARVRSLVLTLAGLAVAFVACVVVLRRLRNARAATLAVRRESARQLRFLANVSHEIRSLLTAIAGFVEMLRSERDSLSEAEISEYLEIVSVQTRQLSSLVEDVLTVSRLEADQLTLDLADVGLRSAVQAVVDIAFSELD